MRTSRHDHKRCITAALAEAERICAAKERRFTPLRRRVLELVWASHKPRTAYDILAVLMAEGYGSSPPVAYRALNFLTEQGLVHKLQHMNAFVGCPGAGHNHLAQLFVCESCGVVTESTHNSTASGLRKAAEEIGFRIKRPMIEVLGRCHHCRLTGSP